MAMGGGEGKRGRWAPARSFWRWREEVGAALVAEDGRNQLKRVEWRHWRHGHIPETRNARQDSRQEPGLGGRREQPGSWALNLNLGRIKGP